jgi:hypothetical protein
MSAMSAKATKMGFRASMTAIPTAPLGSIPVTPQRAVS